MKFNFFYSLPFWIALISIVIIVRLLVRDALLRMFILVVSSILMISAIPSFTLESLAALLILAIYSYSIGYILNSRDKETQRSLRTILGFLGISGILGFLAFFKYGFIQALFIDPNSFEVHPGTRVFVMIGVSYFSFKMIHFLIESYRKKIEHLSLMNYFSYVLFFPSFISGPINRYNHFVGQFGPVISNSFRSDFIFGAERIINGLFKKFVLAQIIHHYVLKNQVQALTGISPGECLIGLYAYAFYFYFDFSGYSDLAIGSARLLGFRLPENFNNPFFKRNIRELWTNWHMSLTSWLVDYIYWPIVRKARVVNIFRKRPVLLSNLGMIITFIACGMWHGETANFFLWGVYHGLGLSILTIYQRQKRRVTSPAIRKYFQSKASLAIGTFMTFNFFAIGLAFFVLDLKNLSVLLKNLI